MPNRPALITTFTDAQATPTALPPKDTTPFTDAQATPHAPPPQTHITNHVLDLQPVSLWVCQEQHTSISAVSTQCTVCESSALMQYWVLFTAHDELQSTTNNQTCSIVRSCDFEMSVLHITHCFTHYIKEHDAVGLHKQNYLI